MANGSGSKRGFLDKSKKVHKRPRTEKSGQSEAEASSPEHSNSEIDLRAYYGAPFLIKNHGEGEKYTSLKKVAIVQPKMFDWDFLEEIGVKDRVEIWLKMLNLWELAQKSLHYSIDLGDEMLTTFRLHQEAGGIKYATCRLFNEEVVITQDVMKEVFGFPTEQDLVVSKMFESRTIQWRQLTGKIEEWNNEGGSSYFIDSTLILAHRFMSHNISGKVDGSKVNCTELSFLWRAYAKSEVSSPTLYVWDQIVRRKNERTAARHFYMARMLAEHFGLISKDSVGPKEGERWIVASMIKEKDFRNGLVFFEGELMEHAFRLAEGDELKEKKKQITKARKERKKAEAREERGEGEARVELPEPMDVGNMGGPSYGGGGPGVSMDDNARPDAMWQKKIDELREENGALRGEMARIVRGQDEIREGMNAIRSEIARVLQGQNEILDGMRAVFNNNYETMCTRLSSPSPQHPRMDSPHAGDG